MKIEIKICTKCEQPKPKTHEYFGKGGKRYEFYSMCKICKKSIQNSRYIKKSKPKLFDDLGNELFICYICKIPKVVDYFYKDKTRKNGFSSGCKFCVKNKYTIWTKNNPGRVKINRKRWYKDVGAEKNLLKIYNLTSDRLKKLKEIHNNHCAICDKPNRNNKSLVIDHNHATGKVRGLLCDLCNLGLGRFQDNPEMLTKAIEYLNNPPANLT